MTCLQEWGFAKILMAIKINQKMGWGPITEKRQKKFQLLPRHTINDKNIQFHPIHTRKKRKSHTLGKILCLRRKTMISIPKSVPNYIFLGKWSCWGWREQFKWYFCFWWQCSQSCFVYSQSLFAYEVGLTEVKETDFKDIAQDKRQKTSSIKFSL